MTQLNYRKKRRIAWFILCLSVILSIFILGGWKLSNRRNDVLQYFLNGENGFSIANDIHVRTECGYNLLTLANRIMLEDDSVIQNMDTALQDVEAALSIPEYYAANQSLTNAFDALYLALMSSQASENDKLLASKQSDEFNSRAKTILKDPYNEKALEFNNLLSTFPSNVISFFSGTKDLPLFREDG